MTADHLIGIEQFEADLWKVADNLRANSNLVSNEYFMPILGLIFLRHATNRYYAAMVTRRTRPPRSSPRSTSPCMGWRAGSGPATRPSPTTRTRTNWSDSRKVSRAVYDFSPEQQKNIAAIVWLYRGQSARFLDWSLTPGRYVGVAPVEEDEDFDFEEAMRSIHVDLNELNEEAAELAVRIARNFEELGV